MFNNLFKGGKGGGSSGGDKETPGRGGNAYLQTLVSQSQKMTTLKFVCIFEGILLMWSMYMTYQTSSKIPVRLIPYQFATQQGVADIGPYGTTNAEYLSEIALSDLKLLTDYTPHNVMTQYGRFLNRLDSRLYANESTKLLNDAREKQDKPYSQTFHVQNISMEGTNKVDITGVQAFYEGDLRLEEKPARYFLVYNWVGGIPMVATFIIDNGSERARNDIETASKQIGPIPPTNSRSLPEESPNSTKAVIPGLHGEAPAAGAMSYDKPLDYKPPTRLLGDPQQMTTAPKDQPPPEIQVPAQVPAPAASEPAAPPAAPTAPPPSTDSSAPPLPPPSSEKKP